MSAELRGTASAGWLCVLVVFDDRVKLLTTFGTRCRIGAGSSGSPQGSPQTLPRPSPDLPQTPPRLAPDGLQTVRFALSPPLVRGRVHARVHIRVHPESTLSPHPNPPRVHPESIPSPPRVHTSRVHAESKPDQATNTAHHYC